MRIGRVIAVAVTVAATLTAAPVSASPVGNVYVALGDSFAAGYGIAPQTPSGACLRSAVNYPSLISRELGIGTVRDVTCGAAESANLSSPQRSSEGPVAPQYDALSPDTTLVTIGIGGNDVQLVQLAARCISVLPTPLTPSCSDGPDTVGPRVDAFAARYDEILDEIARRSPAARIVMVGYPTGIRPGGCPGTQPVRPADATYLHTTIERLNAVMAGAAHRHGATFVDLGPSTRDHDVCAAEPWMVGLVPTSPDAIVPLHPNAAGHADAARRILAALI